MGFSGTQPLFRPMYVLNGGGGLQGSEKVLANLYRDDEESLPLNFFTVHEFPSILECGNSLHAISILISPSVRYSDSLRTFFYVEPSRGENDRIATRFGDLDGLHCLVDRTAASAS